MNAPGISRWFAMLAVAMSALLPRSAAADVVTGYIGRGQLVLQTTLGGATKLTVGGNIAFEEREPAIRIDLLSLGIPGMDPTASALMSTQLFPPGGLTIVYDRKSALYTVWSNAKRAYYTAASLTPTPMPTQTTAPAPPATQSAANGIGAVFGFLRGLRDDRALDVELALTGHGTLYGHPVTGLNFQYRKTTTAGKSEDIHGSLQLADDLGSIPIQVAASVKTEGLPESTLKLDATSIAAGTPPDADFAPPPGYVRANSLGDVIGKSLPTSPN